MKTLKINSLKALMNLVLVAAILPACSQTGTGSNSDKPLMDIHSAVMSNNLQMVRQHIEAGMDINVKEPFGGSTPLILAATFGKAEIAKALIDAGADLSISNNEGSTPLHSAAFFCHVEIVQMLMDAKADKTIRNNFGVTPRETVVGPFSDVKQIYEVIQKQLEPMGLKLDMAQLEKTRPVVAMMLQ